MVSAIVGLAGVLVGAILAYFFESSRERRGRRLDALVEVAGAASRVLGAHERLHELFQNGSSPPIADPRAQAALQERSAAHSEWRKAGARLEILIVDDERIHAALVEFDDARTEATLSWVQVYHREGEHFDFGKYSAIQTASWLRMRAARRSLVALARQRAQLDMRWTVRVPVLQRGRRNAATASALNGNTR